MLKLKKVLIVEDSDVQAYMYNIIFAKYAKKVENKEDKVEVLFAPNGKEAMQIITKNADLDLVITDINMPEMDGLQFLTILRQSRLVNCPIIIISTSDNMAKLKSAKEQKLATEFVVKPWNMKELQVLIESLTKIR